MTTLPFFTDDTFSGGSGSISTDGSTNSEHSWRRHRFRLLYQANHDDLWKYCLRRAATTEEAEDALAETFSVAWRRLDVVPQGNEARPWLFGVARNQLRSGWRKNERAADLRDRLIHQHGAQHAPDPAEQAADRSSAILTAMSTLREKDQEVLRLAAWEELPHVEIAQLLGCSENAVAIRVHRARARLAKAMAKHMKAAENRSKRENVKAQDISTHVGVTSPTPSGKEA